MAFFCIAFIILSILTWSAFGRTGINGQFELFTELICDSFPVCLLSEPSRSFEVASPVECGLSCQRQKSPPELCVGVNYRQDKKVCDVFYSDKNIGSSSNFTKNETGCQYIQRRNFQNLNCAVIFPVISEVCSSNSSFPLVVDSANCSFPFTYNSKIFYNCTTQLTGVPDKCAPSACLMGNRTAARCKQPADFVATYNSIEIAVVGQLNVTTTSIFGWIVIMSRNGTSGNWSVPWSSYKNGFTLSNTDFWIGLERIHQLTSSASCRLRFELDIPQGGLNWRSVEYLTFSIDSEAAGYALNVNGFSGDVPNGLIAGNSFNNVNGRKFYTYDVDNAYRCSKSYGIGGWWFNACATACLTGNANNTIWYYVNYFLRQSRMMIKTNL